MRRHIFQQVDYNVWATKKMVDFLNALDPHHFELPISNSFPTLKDTILHIYAAEKTWVLRMNATPPKIWPANNYVGSTKMVLQDWLRTSTNLKHYVDQLSEKELLEKIAYTSFEGIKLANTKEQILYHVINHSSYHRGQIVTITKQLGITGAPSTDLFYYYNANA